MDKNYTGKADKIYPLTSDMVRMLKLRKRLELVKDIRNNKNGQKAQQ